LPLSAFHGFAGTADARDLQFAVSVSADAEWQVREAAPRNRDFRPTIKSKRQRQSSADDEDKQAADSDGGDKPTGATHEDMFSIWLVAGSTPIMNCQ
jgi:hypothetical protein